MRNSVMATVFAPAGTVAATESGAPAVAATLTARAASGAGASCGARACPSGVAAGAAGAAGVAAATATGGRAEQSPPPATLARCVGAEVSGPSACPSPSVNVTCTRKLWQSLASGGVNELVVAPAMFANVVPVAVVACHWKRSVPTPLTSAIVPMPPLMAWPIRAASGAIAGVPVAGAWAGAVVAVPVRATVCVLPAVPPELFVATRVADLAPAGATGLNDTCTRQLDVDVSVAPHEGVPRVKLAAAGPGALNFLPPSGREGSPGFFCVEL